MVSRKGMVVRQARGEKYSVPRKVPLFCAILGLERARKGPDVPPRALPLLPSLGHSRGVRPSSTELDGVPPAKNIG